MGVEVWREIVSPDAVQMYSVPLPFAFVPWKAPWFRDVCSAAASVVEVCCVGAGSVTMRAMPFPAIAGAPLVAAVVGL